MSAEMLLVLPVQMYLFLIGFQLQKALNRNKKLTKKVPKEPKAVTF